MKVSKSYVNFTVAVSCGILAHYITGNYLIGSLVKSATHGIRQVNMKQNAFIEKVANKIEDLGLTTPAILLLEAHKPLIYISDHLLLIAQPTLDLLFPKKFTRDTINFLSDPTHLEQLIISLETTHPQNSSKNQDSTDHIPVITAPAPAGRRE